MHACVVCSTWESNGELGSEAVCEAWVQVKVLGCQVPLVHPWEEVFCKQYVITSHPLIPYRMNVTVINGYPTICIHYNTLPWFKYSPKTFVIVRHSLAVLVILIVTENTFSHMSAAHVSHMRIIGRTEQQNGCTIEFQKIANQVSSLHKSYCISLCLIHTLVWCGVAWKHRGMPLLL